MLYKELYKESNELAKERFPKADPKYPGTGAAGGMGFAFLTFTDAVLESGINIVLDETKLEDYIKDADLVITGEGRMDGQTAMGKAPVGVAKLAKKYGKKVIAFAGAVQRDARACNDAGIDAFFPILRGVVTLEEAMKSENAKRNLADTAEQVRFFAVCDLTGTVERYQNVVDCCICGVRFLKAEAVEDRYRLSVEVKMRLTQDTGSLSLIHI